MYTIINIILFLILTVLGFRYLLENRYYAIKSPINKTEKFLVSNHQYLLLFILGTAIIACGDMMASRLLICILICILALFVLKEPFSISIVFFTYLLFLLYLIYKWIYSPVPDYGFRQYVKYLYPFLLMIFASRIPSSNVFYLKAIKIILMVAIVGSLALICSHTPLRFILGFFFQFLYWGPAIVDFLPVGVIICLSLFSYTKQRKYLLYVILFILPSILWAWRTGILASAIAIVVFAVVRYKVKSIPYVIIGVFVLVGSVLYIPAVRNKMFIKQMSAEEVLERSGELSRDDINSSARFAMWEWYMDNFYVGNEVKGCGLGVISSTFKEGLTPFSGGAPHNEYLILLCDTGWIGIILYGLIFLSLIIHSFIVYFNPQYQMLVRMSGLIAGGSLAGMMSTLYTDNVVTYSLLTLSYPFALYGMMLSLKRKYNN